MIGEGKFAFFDQIASDYRAYKGENRMVHSNPSTTTNIQISKGSGFAVRLSPVLVYFINKTFAVEATFGNLGYLYSKSKHSSNGIFSLEAKNSSYGFDLLGGLSFGLNFYFGQVKETATPTAN